MNPAFLSSRNSSRPWLAGVAALLLGAFTVTGSAQPSKAAAAKFDAPVALNKAAR